MARWDLCLWMFLPDFGNPGLLLFLHLHVLIGRDGLEAKRRPDLRSVFTQTCRL